MTRRSTIFATALMAAVTLAAAGPSLAQGWGGGGGPGMGMGGGMGMGRGMGMGMNNPDAPWRQRFAAIDENGDGVITPKEAAANAGGVFDAMDADNSGNLTREEYMAVRMGSQRGWNKARQAERQAEKAARFTPMDTNRDGRVDRAEFLAGAQARFQAADRDRDGNLTPVEFRRRAW